MIQEYYVKLLCVVSIAFPPSPEYSGTWRFGVRKLGREGSKGFKGMDFMEDWKIQGWVRRFSVRRFSARKSILSRLFSTNLCLLCGELYIFIANIIIIPDNIIRIMSSICFWLGEVRFSGIWGTGVCFYEGRRHLKTLGASPGL